MTKITLTDGTIFEGTAAEYAEFYREMLRLAKADEVKPVERPITSYDDLAVGMTLKCVSDEHCDCTVGKTYEIAGKDRDGDYYVMSDDESIDIFTMYRKINKWTKDFVIFGDAPSKPDEPALKVGDYARVTGEESRIDNLSVGDIVKLGSNPHGPLYKFNAVRVSDGKCELFKAGDLVKATDAEVAAAKAAQAAAEQARKETERWEKIGRKVNEFRKGDIVRVTGGNGHEKGIYGEVVGLGETRPLVKSFGGGMHTDLTLYCYADLVTPVESRFDRN